MKIKDRALEFLLRLTIVILFPLLYVLVILGWLKYILMFACEELYIQSKDLFRDISSWWNVFKD